MAATAAKAIRRSSHGFCLRVEMRDANFAAGMRVSAAAIPLGALEGMLLTGAETLR